MTAPVTRPESQSETPAPGATEETQIDGRFAPYPAPGPEVVGQEPEPETDVEMDADEPAEGLPVVSPILTGEQIMDLCTGAGRGEALTVADRLRAQMLRAAPYISPGILPEMPL